MILVYNHKETIIQTPPIPVLERGKLSPTTKHIGSVRDEAQAQIESATFTLKGSGRVIRRVDGSLPINLRTWKPPQAVPCENEQTLEQALAGRQLMAETIYIAKPLAHLLAMASFGTTSWKPWFISLGLDLTRWVYKVTQSGQTITIRDRRLFSVAPKMSKIVKVR